LLKAKLLDKKPNLEVKVKKSKAISVEDISKIIDELNLKYKRIDEIDIYNIIKILLDSKGVKI